MGKKVKVVLQTAQQTMVWRNVPEETVKIIEGPESPYAEVRFFNEKNKTIEAHYGPASTLVIEEE